MLTIKYYLLFEKKKKRKTTSNNQPIEPFILLQTITQDPSSVFNHFRCYFFVLFVNSLPPLIQIPDLTPFTRCFSLSNRWCSWMKPKHFAWREIFFFA